MYQDWSRLIMNEEDKYTGVMFAALNKRANLVAQLALESLGTDAAKPIMDQAKAKGETVTRISQNMTWLPVLKSMITNRQCHESQPAPASLFAGSDPRSGSQSVPAVDT